ncbi:hypothetical protein [Bradyrhizobium sp. LVM 105]|uniref:hypothetical protein n=1 Tax=Bradyrhizobium sp. LVM 105 TaxID=2341115 RepID=UPI000F8092E3|nr:hypothetical protein [Bradyrhizobium sp. LVM 105]
MFSSSGGVELNAAETRAVSRARKWFFAQAVAAFMVYSSRRAGKASVMSTSFSSDNATLALARRQQHFGQDDASVGV